MVGRTMRIVGVGFEYAFSNQVHQYGRAMLVSGACAGSNFGYMWVRANLVSTAGTDPQTEYMIRFRENSRRILCGGNA